MKLTWLHVSDFHLGSAGADNYDSDVVLRALVQSVKGLRDDGRAPDLIFATGDIAHSADPNQYKLATKFFDDLLAAAGLERRHLFVVPGNHDVDRESSNALKRTLASGRDADDYFRPGKPKLHITSKQAAYTAWWSDYFGGLRTHPTESTVGSIEIVEVAGRKVAVVPINTALFAHDAADHAQLWVGRRCLDNAVTVLDAMTAGTDVLRIALMHHPLDWLHPEEGSHIEDKLTANVDLILSGHLHQPKAAVIDGALRIAAGASYQTRRRPQQAAYVTVEGTQATVFPIRYEDGPEKWTHDTSLYSKDPAYEGHFKLREGETAAAARAEEELIANLDAVASDLAEMTSRLDRVDFIGLPRNTRPREVRLSDLFVPLDFEPLDPGARRMKLPELQTELVETAPNRVGRFVVFGDPGSGKTTLCRYLAVEVAKGPAPRLAPLFFSVRDYVEEGNYLSILAFIAKETERYLPVPVGYRSVLKLCEAGRAILLIDGLDEVPDVVRRAKLRDAVELLAAACPNLPIVVTSRPAGYDETPLRSVNFRPLHLAPFDDDALDLFVERWSQWAEPQDGHLRDQKRGKLSAALNADPRVKDLARRPILATLMALVQGEARLPGERAQLLRLFVDTLLITWPATFGRRFPDAQRRFDEGRQLATLQTLALRFQEKPIGGGRTLPAISWKALEDEIVDIFRQRVPNSSAAEHHVLAREWVRWLTRDCGILIEQGPGMVSFLDPSLMAHLAGEALFERESALGFAQVATFVRDHCRDPHWREPLLLMLGQRATIARLVGEIVETLTAVANAGSTGPIERLETWTFVIAMLREEVDLTSSQIDIALCAAAQAALEVPQGHLTATSSWLAEVMSHSYRHRGFVTDWFERRLRSAGGLPPPPADPGPLEPSLLGIALLSGAGDTRSEQLTSILAGRTDLPRVADELLTLWPRHPLGEWAKEQADQQGILRWAGREVIDIASWLAIACLTRRRGGGGFPSTSIAWKNGCAAATVFLLRRAAWIGNLHHRPAAFAASSQVVVRWMEAPVLPQLRSPEQGTPARGKSCAAAIERVEALASNFARGSVASSYHLATQRGMARGLARNPQAEFFDLIQTCERTRTPLRPVDVAVRLVNLMADAFEHRFRSRVLTELEANLRPDVPYANQSNSPLAVCWRFLAEDAITATPLLVLAAAEAYAGLALREIEDASAEDAVLMAALRLQNVWLNLFFDRLTEYAGGPDTNSEELALLYAIGLVQRQTTGHWPLGETWPALRSNPRRDEHWLAAYFGLICDAVDQRDDEVYRANRLAAAGAALDQADWPGLAQEIRRYAVLPALPQVGASVVLVSATQSPPPGRTAGKAPPARAKPRPTR